MRINPDDFRRHYAMLSDEALFALDRSELIETAQACYDEEVARRKADLEQAPEPSAVVLDDEIQFGDQLALDSEEEPDWLDSASCACAFSVNQGAEYTPDLVKARAILRAAAIPCHITLEQVETPTSPKRVRSEYCVMVPGALNLHAISVLDRDMFNADQEENWRAELAALSDEDLHKLNPDELCAGLLDRVARLKKAYEEEVAARRQ